MATLLRKGKQHSCLFYVDQNDLSHYCSPQSAALIRQQSMRRQQGSTTTGTTQRLSAPLQTQDSHCAHTGKTLTELVCQTYQTGRQCQQPAGKTRFSAALSAEVDSAEGVGAHNVHWYGRPTLQLAALALRRVGLATTTNAAAGGVIGRADRPWSVRFQMQGHKGGIAHRRRAKLPGCFVGLIKLAGTTSCLLVERFSVALSAEVDSEEGASVHNVHWHGRPTIQLAALVLGSASLPIASNAATGFVIGRAVRVDLRQLG